MQILSYCDPLVEFHVNVLFLDHFSEDGIESSRIAQGLNLSAEDAEYKVFGCHPQAAMDGAHPANLPGNGMMFKHIDNRYVRT